MKENLSIWLASLHQSVQIEKTSDVKLGVIEKKAALEARADVLRSQLRDSQLSNYRMEVHNR